MRVFACVGVMAAIASTALAADDPTKFATRTTVPFETAKACTSPTSVADLGTSYYTESSVVFVAKLKDVLHTCPPLSADDGYVMVLLSVVGADLKGAVVHVLLAWNNGAPKELAVLPGVSSMTWVFLSDSAKDRPIAQLMSTAVDNPLAAKAGSLAASLLGAYPGVAFAARSTPLVGPPTTVPAPIYAAVAHHVSLPFARASISEKDVVQGPRDDHGKEDPVAGSFDFANVPKSWLTIHAGAGVLTGSLNGVSPAKVDHDLYISDPPKRAATLVGVAFHAPFDSTRPVASGAERFGVVLAGVLTPAAGIYIGPSYGWRALSVTAGPVWMWLQTTPKDFQIGDATKAVKDGGPSPQLVLGRVRAWLIGATYTIK